jgi:hypothetical protein
LTVKANGTNFCGARFVLDEITDFKPWPDSDNYVLCYSVKEIEFCIPFDISALSNYDKYWAPKYLIGSKIITENSVLNFLETSFNNNITKELQQFAVSIDNELELETIESEKEFTELIKAVPDLKIDIMGTFQTISFTNETDKIRGLESLVNNSFYSLFAQYQKENTLLIQENRMFKTEGVKNITGIRSIPDAILIQFIKNSKYPVQINLIEYECYGESKNRSIDKSNYMNSHIIPQLMLFASSFSIITDQVVRESTIKKWIGKIIDQINQNEEFEQRVSDWIRINKPNIKEKEIYLELQKMLEEGFKNNIKVLLIIDELSSDQKDTIRNVIKSFKLINDESISFDAYIVRLVQKINILNTKSEYALTVQ